MFKRDILILFCHVLSFLYSGSQFILLRTYSTAQVLHISIFRLLNIPRTSGEGGREVSQEAVCCVMRELSYVAGVKGPRTYLGFSSAVSSTLFESSVLPLRPHSYTLASLNVLLQERQRCPPPQNYLKFFLKVPLW